MLNPATTTVRVPADRALEALRLKACFSFQVIIIGGGPAGCAIALSIAKHTAQEPVRVLVVDDADLHAYKVRSR